MATRLAVLAAALSVVVAAPLMPAPAYAQERTELVVPKVENSKYQFAGMINTNAVQVRSGPSENYYATMRLDKGTAVTVVGIKLDWLKIVPPEGSYSLIARVYVQRQGDSKVGTITRDDVRVRAASTMTPLKTSIQCKLNKGASVTILGEQDEYYQIKPPADAFLYVHQKYVDMVKQLNEKPLPVASKTSGKSPSDSSTAEPEQAPTTQMAANISIQENPTPTRTTPSEDELAAAKARAEEAKAAREAAKVESDFDNLEALLKATVDKPLAEQPLAELLEGYEKALKSEYLSVPMRRISEVRLVGLRGKLQAQKELLATRKQQQEANERIAAIRAQREALEQKMGGNVTVYTAVGKLQASTLQVGPGTLYRLVDPNTGRTLCYVRNTDPKYTSFLDQFVGVRGELASDPQISLKVVTATETEAADPAKVNNGITAQVSPTSLIPKGAEKTETPAKPAKEEKSE